MTEPISESGSGYPGDLLLVKGTVLFRKPSPDMESGLPVLPGHLDEGAHRKIESLFRGEAGKVADHFPGGPVFPCLVNGIELGDSNAERGKMKLFHGNSE